MIPLDEALQLTDQKSRGPSGGGRVGEIGAEPIAEVIQIVAPRQIGGPQRHDPGVYFGRDTGEDQGTGPEKVGPGLDRIGKGLAEVRRAVWVGARPAARAHRFVGQFAQALRTERFGLLADIVEDIPAHDRAGMTAVGRTGPSRSRRSAIDGDAPITLLNHMRQFVPQQPLPWLRSGSIFTAPHGDMVPDGKSPRMQGHGQACGFWGRVQPNLTEVASKARFEEIQGAGLEWLATGFQTADTGFKVETDRS